MKAYPFEGRLRRRAGLALLVGALAGRFGSGCLVSRGATRRGTHALPWCRPLAPLCVEGWVVDVGEVEDGGELRGWKW
jgi:hypothetical protein